MKNEKSLFNILAILTIASCGAVKEPVDDVNGEHEKTQSPSGE